MLNCQKIVVVMPAYNAARTLRQTYDEVMAHGIVDLVIVVDDASHDETVEIRLKPLPDACGESSHWRQAFGISHRLSRIFAPIVGAAATGGKLQRFCFR